MTVDLRREAGLSHVSDITVFRALHEQGFKAYHEEFKFILTVENKAERMVSTISQKDLYYFNLKP